MVLWHQNN